jgi:YggT family protein
MVLYLVNFLNILLSVLSFALIGRFILSLLDPPSRWPVTRIIMEITEPILRPIRQLLPSTGFIDFSPTVALLIIWLLQFFLQQSLGGLR